MLGGDADLNHERLYRSVGVGVAVIAASLLAKLSGGERDTRAQG